ncbi:hypothetical protein ACPCAC_26070 [Streptomyces lavendulocolor]|uniref:hypothetical protein n=1 Tax=Streptomyces lavendulocolor TaxID=67316 RepID=UPI003C309C85
MSDRSAVVGGSAGIAHPHGDVCFATGESPAPPHAAGYLGIIGEQLFRSVTTCSVHLPDTAR